jgi:hypothetical protein
LEKNCTSVFITLSIPYISLVLSESVFDGDDDGVDVDPGKESFTSSTNSLHKNSNGNIF